MSLAAQVLAAAQARKVMIATAESCTGGLVAAALTDIAGSSAGGEGGFVTYSNAAKVELLGVSPGDLAEFGAVSEAVARGMAAGALAHSRAQLAVATTGIAGPGGAEPGKPVGLVYIAVAWDDGAHIRHTVYPGDRAAVIAAAARDALALALDHLRGAL